MMNVKKNGILHGKNMMIFFYDNKEIANRYCFITVLDGETIGHISWNPRHRPDYVEIGHNCILTKCKGKGYGHLQLEKAIRRIKDWMAKYE